MLALKLYGPRTGRQNSYGAARGPCGPREWTYDFSSKQPGNSPGSTSTGPGTVMWLGHCQAKYYYPPFPLLSYFSVVVCLEMVVLSYSVIYYIYIPGTLGPCFHYWCSVYGICKWSDTLWPVGRVRLFADYTISLSSLCRLIWKHWTTKMLVRYMMPSVCLRLRQFSQLSLYSLYGAVCLQLTQFTCDDRENVYFILLSSSNRKYESLTIV